MNPSTSSAGKSEDLLVSELKNMIYKRQLMLSTRRRCALRCRRRTRRWRPVASSVLIRHDAAVRQRGDAAAPGTARSRRSGARLQGVLLEDHVASHTLSVLSFYGLIDKVESNLFLARANPSVRSTDPDK